jgi:hypothetical protein
MRAVRNWMAAGLLIVAQAASAQAPWPAAVTDYLTMLQRVEQTAAPVSLEPLFAAVEPVRDTLMQTQDGDRAWMERLSDTDYAALQSALRGIKLSRGLDIYAQPDAGFFDALARAHGGDADRRFFRLYRAFWDRHDFPRYLAPTAGTTLCVRFGEGIIPALYVQWSAFARKNPHAYAEFTQQTLRDLEEAVGLGVCACGDANSVVRELKGFVRRFPQTTVADQVRARLQELKETPDRHPVKCR